MQRDQLLSEALRECEARLTLLVEQDRHKLLDLAALGKAREALRLYDEAKAATPAPDLASAWADGHRLDALDDCPHGYTAEEAAAYMAALKEAKRYRRDVY